MIEWLVLVMGCAGAAVAVRALARRRGQVGGARLPERLAPSLLGLERLPPLGAFVQLSAPYAASSRVSLNRLAEASAHHAGRVTVVEIGAGAGRARLTGRADPMVMYVDGSGVVRRRWAAPPERSELAAILAAAQERVVAGSAEKPLSYSSATRSSSVVVSSGVSGAAANSRSC